MSNIVDFPLSERRFEDMFHEIHVNAPSFADLDPSWGSADDWLFAALAHLKTAVPCGSPPGRFEVSAAALSLLIMKIEELVYEGPKLTLSISE